MLKHWRRTLALLGVVAATGLVYAAVALAKKPAPPPPPPQPQPTVQYEITFLPPLPGQTSAWVNDLNNNGAVVGRSYYDGGSCAFLYTPAGGTVDLNDLIDAESGWYLVSAGGINDAGQIVGRGYVNGQMRAYRFTPGVDGAAPVLENLGTLGGDSVGCGINDWGEVTGWYRDAADSTYRSFVYTDADGDGTQEMIDIGDLGGNCVLPEAINNDGQVTGWSLTSGEAWFPGADLWSHAFRYTPGVGGLPGEMEDLAPLAEYSGGRDIDDNGHVVGSASTDQRVRGWYPNHAFLYTDEDGLTDLGTLGGYTSSAAGINSGGEVVGVSRDGTTKDPSTQPLHGFLYTNKTDTGEFVMVKLEDPNLIVNLPADFQEWIRPEAINDSGQICGKTEGSMQAVLLTPVTP